MNEKSYELLQHLLLHPEEPVSVHSLSETFQVSERTIKNYFSVIEDFLKNNQYEHLIENVGGKIQFIGTKEQAQEIIHSAIDTSFYDYKLSAQERQFIISLMLLISDEPIKLSQFEESLFVSKRSIIKDIAAISNFFLQNDITFIENKHNGFLIVAKESTRRNAIYRLVRNAKYSPKLILEGQQYDICISFFKSRLHMDMFYPKVKMALRVAEQHYKVSMSDYDFFSLVFVLCIGLFRFSEGHPIESKYVSGIVEDKEMKLEIAEYLCRLLLEPYEHTRQEFQAECEYVADRIKRRVILDSSGVVRENPIDFYIIVKGFLNRLSNAYQVNLLSDYNLQEFLTAHITGIYHRLKEGEKLLNPYRAQLANEYPSEYKILLENIDFLEEMLYEQTGETLNEDEKTYILMHIVAALERLRQNSRVPNVIVICHMGFGASQLLSEKLKKHYKVNITNVITAHSVQKEMFSQSKDLFQGCDFVISTTPLFSIPMPVPWVQVDPLLSQTDMDRITQLIENFTAQPSKSAKPPRRTMVKAYSDYAESEERVTGSATIQFSSLLLPQHILLDKSADDWKEAIIYAGEPLLWSKCITPDYLMTMVTNVLENGPYYVFAPGVAIAHANPQDGALEIGATFLRLAKPVRFHHKHNDPVRFVLALSITDPKKYMDMLFTTMNVLCDPEALSHLGKARDTQTVLDIFRRYE